MAAYDLEEQEQIDALKTWWARYGNQVATVVIVVCVAWLGWQGWRWYNAGHIEAASTLYRAVADAEHGNDTAKAKEAMTQLADRYAGTPYAPRAALLYAKMLWDAGDRAGARAQLQWVLEHSSDRELLQVTRFRLAETWLDEGKSDEALKVLDAKTDDAFAGIYADLRGDALVAAGRTDEARKAYETALAKIDARSPYRNYIEVKYQSLGGGTAPSPAPGVSFKDAAASAMGAGAARTPAAPATPAPTPTPPANPASNGSAPAAGAKP